MVKLPQDAVKMKMEKRIQRQKQRKMYVRKYQMTLIKYARRVHGEYIVNTTETKTCNAQKNRKCVHAVVHTLLKNEWEVLAIQTLIDFLPLHSWKSDEIVPLKYPQMVTLRFDDEKVKLGEACVLRADPKSWVSNRAVPSWRQLTGRKWVDDHGFVLTERYLEVPRKFLDGDLEALVAALTEKKASTYRRPPKRGTFNYERYGCRMPNGNFRFYRENERALFAPKESFGICGEENHFSQCFLVDVCV